MDLGPIDKSNLFNNIGQADKAGKSERAGSASNKNAGKTGNANADKLQLSDIDLSNDIEFARKALQNHKKTTFENITEIRNKVKSGELDSNDVQNTVSKMLSNEIAFLDSLIVEETSKKQPAKSVKTELTPELKEKLTQNDEVLNSISNKILDKLINL